MTKITLEVGGLFSVLGAHGIERQLRRVAGVGSVSVNPVSGSTTVKFDAGKSSVAAIEEAIKDCGFHCAGEALPRHICEKPAMPDSGPKALTGQLKPAHSETHQDHSGMAGMKSADAMAKPEAHGGDKSDAMAHEMGHGAGMDMQVMVRDMRNRFWIALAFSLPIFLFSPMGMDSFESRHRSACGSTWSCLFWRAPLSSTRFGPSSLRPTERSAAVSPIWRCWSSSVSAPGTCSA
jgi:Cu2+-exporting ATPase